MYTNASYFQLVAVISHKGKLIYLYDRKLIDYQKSYTVSEKELLIIDEFIRGFITILLRQRLRMYTDNKTYI